jgi:hypothetical protein
MGGNSRKKLPKMMLMTGQNGQRLDQHTWLGRSTMINELPGDIIEAYLNNEISMDEARRRLSELTGVDFYMEKFTEMCLVYMNAMEDEIEPPPPLTTQMV